MKTYKNFTNIIRNVINEYKIQKSNKIIKIYENLNSNKLDLKQEYWLKKVIIKLSDEVFLKDIKITNVTWEDIFDLYNKNYNPDKAVNALIRLDESDPYQPINALFKTKGFSTKYSDTSFIELLDKIQDMRKKGEQRTVKSKYEIPYIHNTSIKKIKIYDEDGKEYSEVRDETGVEYDLDKLRKMVMTRPKVLLTRNQKAQHSETEFDIVYNLGLPALKALCVDEDDPDKPFTMINTCPGAGACIQGCFAMKGSYVQFNNVSLKLTQTLNYLVNDFEGFKKQLSSQIQRYVNTSKSKNKKSGTVLNVLVRFHDSGDFFSPDYTQLAEDIAIQFPTVIFYAYTKEPRAYAKLRKLPNFITNYSLEAKKKLDAYRELITPDGDVITKKNAKLAIVIKPEIISPNETHIVKYDTGETKKVKIKKGKEFVRDENGKYVYRIVNVLKWKWESEDSFKSFAKKLYNIYGDDFGITEGSIITYTDWLANHSRDTSKNSDENHKWNVVILPGTDGDLAASRDNVKISFLIAH